MIRECLNTAIGVMAEVVLLLALIVAGLMVIWLGILLFTRWSPL